MDNPCKKCIVGTMCREKCYKYESYLKSVAHRFGYKIRRPERLAWWIKKGSRPGSTSGWSAFLTSPHRQITISVEVDGSGTISRMETVK